ncbi:MAG: mevalonate kinase [Anaerolineales bacterium]|nr:mevalonate kinase [Anaerolineales bacterium]
MPAFTATAPGKIILFGEHAVVYGEPAIAVPVSSIQTRASVKAVIDGISGEIQIDAPDISLSSSVSELDPDHPLRAAVMAVVGNKNPEEIPACKIQISSTIPTASGLGSGAAVSAALIRALSAFLGQRLIDEQVSDLTFEVEKIHHGTPSGIDNTVIAHQKPVYYVRGEPFEFLSIGEPFSILIAGSGIPGHTREAVQRVRKNWINDPDRYDSIFKSIGEISKTAKDLIDAGSPADLGPLMNENHILLQELGVSTPELDLLVETARQAGALGAKLSGGGLGGNIIALVDEETDQITEALTKSGAAYTLNSTIPSTKIPG